MCYLDVQQAVMLSHQQNVHKTALFTSLHVMLCPDASVVHASGSGQLQANPHVAGPWLSPVATMGSNDLVVGEDHVFGPSC